MSSVTGAQYDDAGVPPLSSSADRSAVSAGTVHELELIKKAQHGDRGSYGRLVLLYQDRLFNALCRMVGDHEEARDLAQETFTRGLDKIEGFRGDASPYTWLFRIATNLSISRMRKTQRHRTFSLDRPGGDSASKRGSGSGDGEDQASALLDRVAAQRADEQQTPDRTLEKRERNEKVLEAARPAGCRIPRSPGDARHRRFRLPANGRRARPAAGNAEESIVQSAIGAAR